jgi:hypothetical protein
LQHAYTFLRTADVSQLSQPDATLLLGVLPPVPELRELREQLADRLRGQTQSGWFADVSLVTLFGTLNALHAYDPSWVSGGDIASAAKRLVDAELRVGGPYAGDTGEPEPLLNAQVALCMQWAAAPLPHLLEFLQQACEIAVHRQSDEDRTLILAVSQLQDDSLQALISRGSRGQASQLTLWLGKQHADGGWPALKTMNRFQATAYAIRWLHDHAPISSPPQDVWQSSSQSVFEACRKQYASLGEPLRSYSLTALRHIQAVDTEHEIALLATFFAAALQSSNRPPTRMSRLLGQANVHAWIAYVIYDDFLDDEGSPAMLSPANVALRLSLEAYRQALPSDTYFQKFVQETFTAADAANAWEIAHCRLELSPGHVTIPALPSTIFS